MKINKPNHRMLTAMHIVMLWFGLMVLALASSELDMNGTSSTNIFSLLFLLTVVFIFIACVHTYTTHRSNSPKYNPNLDDTQHLHNQINRLQTSNKKNTSKNNMLAFKNNIILESVSDGVLQLNAKGNIEYSNDSLQKMFGYKEKELIGKKIELLLPSDREQKNFYHNRIINNTNTEQELQATHKNGNKFPVELKTQKIESEHEKDIFLCIVTNNSKKLKTDEELNHYTDRLEWTHFELQRARIEAEQANHAKSIFLANMSHEIRTPLNGVIGMTELLMNTDLTEKQNKYAQRIYSSGENLLALINDILDFSKVEAGEMHVEETNLDLKQLIEEVISMFINDTDNKGVKLKSSYLKSVPKDIVGDPVRIRQILTNLISNSVKFTKKGKIDVKVSKRKSTKSKVTLLIEVTDTGLGIAKDKQDTIFDKFAQADISTTREYGGTGLGLAICQQLVELMGGKIGLDSTLGKGSRFWFEITVPMQKTTKKV